MNTDFDTLFLPGGLLYMVGALCLPLLIISLLWDRLLSSAETEEAFYDRQY